MLTGHSYFRLELRERTGLCVEALEGRVWAQVPEPRSRSAGCSISYGEAVGMQGWLGDTLNSLESGGQGMNQAREWGAVGQRYTWAVRQGQLKLLVIRKLRERLPFPLQ